MLWIFTLDFRYPWYILLFVTIQMRLGNKSGATAGRWPRLGHMTSSQVTKKFISITPNRKEVRPWARCHCAYLVKAHRLICIMTYLGHPSAQVIWPNPTFNLLGSRREEYDGVSRFSVSWLVHNLFAKTMIWPKSNNCKKKLKLALNDASLFAFGVGLLYITTHREPSYTMPSVQIRKYGD